MIVGALVLIWNGSIWQTAVGSDKWSDWTRLGLSENKGIFLTCGTNQDGRLEIFLIGIANIFHPGHPKPPGGTTDIWHSWQTSSSALTWSGWEPL